MGRNMKLEAHPILVSQMKPQTFSSVKQGNLSIIQLIVRLGFLLCVGENIVWHDIEIRN